MSSKYKVAVKSTGYEVRKSWIQTHRHSLMLFISKMQIVILTSEGCWRFNEMIHVKCFAKVWHADTGCHKGYRRSHSYSPVEWPSSNYLGHGLKETLQGVCVCVWGVVFRFRDISNRLHTFKRQLKLLFQHGSVCIMLKNVYPLHLFTLIKILDTKFRMRREQSLKILRGI